MKAGFKNAGKIFKYLVILFTIVFLVYVVWDDWVLVERYWKEHWLEYIGLWTLWFLVYLLALSFYYWIGATSVILIYYKIIPKIKKQKAE